jgi:ubiquitin carboxyl-terminal hydrolase L5
VALINIVNNISGIHLGSQLEAFKRATLSLLPAQRGARLASNAHIKRVHNMFARKIDMLSTDVNLADAYDTAQRRQARKRPGARKPRTKKGNISGGENASNHFIAFMPIQGKIWGLDGLENYPLSYGTLRSAASCHCHC